MNQVLTTFGPLSFQSVLGLFVIAFVIHEIEEWNITEFERRNFVDVPATVTLRNARMWIGIVCLVALVWLAAAMLPGSSTVAAYVFLPAIALAVGKRSPARLLDCLFQPIRPGARHCSVVHHPMEWLHRGEGAAEGIRSTVVRGSSGRAGCDPAVPHCEGRQQDDTPHTGHLRPW